MVRGVTSPVDRWPACVPLRRSSHSRSYLLRGPPAPLPGDDGVYRVRRTGRHHMIERSLMIVGLKTHATWVQDQPVIAEREGEGSGDMGMAAY